SARAERADAVESRARAAGPVRAGQCGRASAGGRAPADGPPQDGVARRGTCGARRDGAGPDASEVEDGPERLLGLFVIVPEQRVIVAPGDGLVVEPGAIVGDTPHGHAGEVRRVAPEELEQRAVA